MEQLKDNGSPITPYAGSSPVARFLIVMAAFIIVVAGMKSAESILVPFLLSLFIAIICTPLISVMKRYRIPTGISIMLVVVLIVIGGIFIGAIIGSSINSFTADIPKYQLRLLELSNNLQAQLAAWGIVIHTEQWRELFNPSAALTMVGNMLTSFGNIMTDGFLILLTVMFILAEEMHFVQKFEYAVKGKRAMESLTRFTVSINKYMAIKTLVSLGTGTLVMLALMVIGVDYPVLWGLLAFLLNFIPTFGSILAAVPPVLLAIVQLSFGDALLVAIFYVVVNVVVGSIVEPKWMGKGLDLSSLIVFLSLVFWGWVLGPVGMLLSVPLTMMVKIALENFPETEWIGIMLGSGTNQTLNEREAGS